MTERTDATPSHATIAACLAEEKVGFVVGQRLSVPFLAELISVYVGKQTSFVGSESHITDFSPHNTKIAIVEKEDRTDIFVRSVSDLQEEYGRWKGEIIVTCCEKGADIFNVNNHIRLKLRFRDDKPEVRIEQAVPASE